MNIQINFREYLVNIKRSSENTVQSYLRDVTQYVDYCTHSSNFDYNKATDEDINHYLDHLSAIGKSEATKTRTLASLRCFYKFLISNGKCSVNPADGIRMKKTKQKLPGVLETNEAALLLSQPSGNDYKSIRDKAMLEILYATGMKVSELIELEINDVNLQIGIARLKKGERERIVPLYPAAIKAISNYISNVRPAIVFDEETNRLFTNMNGQPMSRQGFWKIIKHYSELAGIKKDITPHTLRHSFAAHLLENGAQLKYIKEMLGHSDVSSTQIYAQFIKSKYTEDYAKFHPLAK